MKSSVSHESPWQLVWFPYADASISVYTWTYLSQCYAIFFVQWPAILRKAYFGQYLLYSSFGPRF